MYGEKVEVWHWEMFQRLVSDIAIGEKRDPRAYRYGIRQRLRVSDQYQRGT